PRAVSYSSRTSPSVLPSMRIMPATTFGLFGPVAPRGNVFIPCSSALWMGLQPATSRPRHDALLDEPFRDDGGDARGARCAQIHRVAYVAVRADECLFGALDTELLPQPKALGVRVDERHLMPAGEFAHGGRVVAVARVRVAGHVETASFDRSEQHGRDSEPCRTVDQTLERRTEHAPRIRVSVGAGDPRVFVPELHEQRVARPRVARDLLEA